MRLETFERRQALIRTHAYDPMQTFLSESSGEVDLYPGGAD